MSDIEQSSACLIQAVFRGYMRRKQFRILVNRIKERQAFLKKHSQLTKQLDMRLQENAKLKKGLSERADISHEERLVAADYIKRAWIRKQSFPEASKMRQDYLAAKACSSIQRFYRSRKYRELTEDEIPDPSEAVEAFLHAPHDEDFFMDLKSLDHLYEEFRKELIANRSKDKFTDRMLIRSRELRERIKDERAVLGAASKSLLPKAYAEVNQDIMAKRLWGVVEGISYTHIRQLERLEQSI